MYISSLSYLISFFTYLSILLADGSVASNPLGIKVEYSIAWLNTDSNSFGANLNLTFTKPLTQEFFIKLQWLNNRVQASPFFGNFAPYDLSGRGYALKYQSRHNSTKDQTPKSEVCNFNAKLVLTDSEASEDIKKFIYPNNVTLLIGQYLKNTETYDITTSDFIFNKNEQAPNMPFGPSFTQNPYLDPKVIVSNDSQDAELLANGNYLVGIPIGLIIYSIIFTIGSISYLFGHITRSRLRNRIVFRRSK